MNCQQCNVVLPDDAQFCPDCGSTILASQTVSSSNSYNRSPIREAIPVSKEAVKYKVLPPLQTQNQSIHPDLSVQPIYSPSATPTVTLPRWLVFCIISALLGLVLLAVLASVTDAMMWLGGIALVAIIIVLVHNDKSQP